jgi:hypothetical protein
LAWCPEDGDHGRHAQDNGTAAADGPEWLLKGKLPIDRDEALALPGTLLSPDCAVTAKTFEEQYGSTRDFAPLDCSKYNS